VPEWNIYCNRYDIEVIEIDKCGRTQYKCGRWLKTVCSEHSKTDDFSMISFEFTVERNPHHYVRNIASVSTAISFVGLCSFIGLRVEDNPDRAAINVTLLLAAISLKFAFSQAIPKLPYDTCLDKKLTRCMILLMFLTVGQHVAAAFQSGVAVDIGLGIFFLVPFFIIEYFFWTSAWRLYYCRHPKTVPLPSCFLRPLSSRSCRHFPSRVGWDDVQEDKKLATYHDELLRGSI
jgi:hypothetical protein